MNRIEKRNSDNEVVLAAQHQQQRNIEICRHRDIKTGAKQKCKAQWNPYFKIKQTNT